MKSKIIALSKNEEFKNFLKRENYQINMLQFFLVKLDNKNNNKLNISFVTKKNWKCC